MQSRRLVVIGVVIAIIALAGYGGVRYMTTPNTASSRPWPDANDLDLKDAGGVTDGFQLTLRAEKTQVYAGDPIWVYASLKNTNLKTGYVDVDKNTENDFFLIVQDEQHKLVSFTKYMDVMAPHPPGAEGSYNLPQKYNEDILFRVKASQLYEMTAPGTYFITLKYKSYLPGSSNLHYVVSNTVTVEVRDSAAVEMAPPKIIIKSSQVKTPKLKLKAHT